MIKSVGVVGAGTMGNGIAQVFAQSGLEVRLVDVAQPMLDRARASIDKSLSRFVDKKTGFEFLEVNTRKTKE